MKNAILALVPNPKAAEAQFATFYSGFGSWLLPGLSESAGKTLASTLAGIATIGFVAAGMGLLGFLVPVGWWRSLAIGAAVVSLLLVVVFWDRYLVAGLVIDVAVLITLIFTRWPPE